MRKIKGISYTEKDLDVIRHIEKQQNQSRYILNLVRQDMERKDLENIIAKKIEEYLDKIELNKSDNSKEEINTESIKDILNME